MTSLTQRLKDKKLVQWVLAYLAGAWGGLQVIGFMTDTYGWSESIVRVAPIVMGGGLLVVLVLAWYHGSTGRQRAAPLELLLLSVILVTTVVSAFVFSGQTKSALPVIEGDDVAAKSLAVLPFVSLSDDRQDAYFASGIHDELLTQLAKLGGLKVISRTSVMTYQNRSDKTLRQIGQELGVATVLEGSVQRSGGRVRVQAQLIDARTDDHLWAESYDRDLTDVFVIQSDIARQIAGALQMQLTPREQQTLAARPTENAEAYDAYLRARDLQRDASTAPVFRQVISLLEQAISLDPDFALAYARISEAHGMMRWYSFDPSPERAARQKQTAEQAMRLAPNLAESHIAEGFYYYHSSNFEEALKSFNRALQLAPGNSEIYGALGFVYRRQARMEQAIATWQRALTLDPLNTRVRVSTAQTYGYLRRYPDALREWQHLVSLDPNDYGAAIGKADSHFALEGQLDSLRAVLKRAPDTGQFYTPPAYARYRLAVYMRDHQAALQAAQSVPELLSHQSAFVPRSLLLGEAYEQLGDATQARRHYETACAVIQQETKRLPNDPRVAVALARCHAGMARNEEAAQAARRAMRLAPDVRDPLVARSIVGQAARVLAAAGQHDEAITLIDQLLNQPSLMDRHELRLDPAYDPLRNSPRFQKLLVPPLHSIPRR